MLDNRFTQHQSVVDKYVNPAASYSMTTRDYVVRADATAGAMTITLPPVAEATGREYSILARVATSVKTVTVQDKNDSESWPGDYVLNANDDFVMLKSDGMKWSLVSADAATLLAYAKIARGTHTSTTASDTVVTGLATVIAVVVSFRGVPSLTHMFNVADIGDQAGAPAAGSILLKSYKPTGSGDVTPIGATTPWAAVDWIAIGT